MKRLDITWNGVFDSTGYLFSFAKSLSCAVKNSPYREYAEDIVASSGFAFRMWIAADLCPSETSIWEFGRQPAWILNGGLEVAYANCCWQPENVLNQARLDILPKIKESIDKGIPVVSWEMGVLEWGLITGYDDETKHFTYLSITGETGELEYEKLGNREMPMLNVIAITGKTDKSKEDIVKDTKALAKTHLSGGEWCDNASGLMAYKRLIDILKSDDPSLAAGWGMEYALGTFAPLKWYVWKFFEKYNEATLAGLYKTVYESWIQAFELKKTSGMSDADSRKKAVELLQTAYDAECRAAEIM